MARRIEGHYAKSLREQRLDERSELRAAPFPAMNQEHARSLVTPLPSGQRLGEQRVLIAVRRHQ